MSTEQIKIDEKYTVQITDGHVEVLRHGRPWLGADGEQFPGNKAWISAAYEIESLRKEVSDSTSFVY